VVEGEGLMGVGGMAVGKPWMGNGGGEKGGGGGWGKDHRFVSV